MIWTQLGRAFESYGFLGLVRLLIDVINTKIFFPGARIIRRPIYLRGKAGFSYGDQFTLGRNARIELFPMGNSKPVLRIGNNVQINDSVHIAVTQSVEIGENVLIASRVFITDHGHGNYSYQGASSCPTLPPNARPLVSTPVKIGSNVWIGEQVSILPGVHIGPGCIVGANSTVTRSFPGNVIIAGSPAKIIKRFDNDREKWILECEKKL